MLIFFITIIWVSRMLASRIIKVSTVQAFTPIMPIWHSVKAQHFAIMLQYLEEPFMRLAATWTLGERIVLQSGDEWQWLASYWQLKNKSLSKYKRVLHTGKALLSYCTNTNVKIGSSSTQMISNDCFFQLQNQTVFNPSQINSFIIFESKNAMQEGGDLYGRTVDNCVLQNFLCSDSYIVALWLL